MWKEFHVISRNTRREDILAVFPSPPGSVGTLISICERKIPKHNKAVRSPDICTRK